MIDLDILCIYLKVVLNTRICGNYLSVLAKSLTIITECAFLLHF